MARVKKYLKAQWAMQCCINSEIKPNLETSGGLQVSLFACIRLDSLKEYSAACKPDPPCSSMSQKKAEKDQAFLC